MSLNLFPARVAIGHAKLPDGSQVDILPTPELLRALAALQVRVGGPNGSNSDEIELLATLSTNSNQRCNEEINNWENEGGLVIASTILLSQGIEDINVIEAMSLSDDTSWKQQIRDLFQRIDGFRDVQIGELIKALQDSKIDLSASRDASTIVTEQRFSDINMLASTISEVAAMHAEIKKFVEGVEILIGFIPTSLIDWTRPGTIGSNSPNSVSATTFIASAAVSLSPANANVVISPTGSGSVTVNPASVGAIDNTTLGANTAKPASVTNLSYSGTLIGGTGVITIGTNHLCKTSSGDIGIGTASPSSRVELSGSGAQYYRSTETGSGASIVYGVTTSLGLIGTTTNHDFRIYSNNVVRMTVLASGTITTTGGFAIGTGFGCNGKTAQTAFSSGGVLAAYGAGANGFDTAAHASALYAQVVAIQAALVANGIMS